jgi:O-antigen/teichoic acid export membrane protein
MARNTNLLDATAAVRRSSVLNALDFVVQTLATFLVTPAMAVGLGMESYGSWLIIMSTFAYLQLLEAGVSTAGTKFLASAIGAKDKTLFGRRLKALRRALGLSGIVAAVIMVAGIGVTTVLASCGQCPSYVPWMVLIYLPPTFLTFWLRDRLIVLRAFLRYELIVATTLGRTVLQTALVLWVLWEDLSFIWLALAHAVPQTLCHLAQHAFAAKMLPEDQGDEPRVEDRKELRSIANHVFASQLALGLTGRAEPFLVTMAGTVSALPLHGIARRFTGMATEAFWVIFGSPLMSAFGRSPDPVVPMLRHYCRIVSLLSGGACAVMVLVSRPFIETWLPPMFLQCSFFIAIIAPGLALRLGSVPMIAFLLARGEHRSFSALSITEALLSIGWMTFLGWTNGLIGLFFGLGITDVLIFGGMLPWFLRKHLRSWLLPFYTLEVLLPMLAGTLPAFFFAWLLPELLTPGYPKLGLFVALSAGVSLFMAYLLSKLRVGGVASTPTQELH